MSRRRRATKRQAAPDPVYQSSLWPNSSINSWKTAKKPVARRIVYRALEKFAQRVKTDNPLEAFEQAIENAKPSLEVKTRRIGGANYQVPVEIPDDRRTSMAMGWIIIHSRSKPGRAMEEALASEFVDCFNNQGSTIKKKDDTHRMAEANKAFAHYKW